MNYMDLLKQIQIIYWKCLKMKKFSWNPLGIKFKKWKDKKEIEKSMNKFRKKLKKNG